MSDLRAKVGQTVVARTDETDPRSLRITRDGGLVAIPWTQALCLEGRVYGVQVGDANMDPVGEATFGAGAIDLTEFDYLQTVPATVAILPIYYNIAFLAVGTAGETGLTVLWGASGVKHASGITPIAYNMRPGSALTSLCTYSALSDTGGTAIVPAGIIYQNITTALTGVAASVQMFIPPWTVATAGFVPVIQGASGTGRQIAAFMNGQAATGYFTAQFAELPIGYIE